MKWSGMLLMWPCCWTCVSLLLRNGGRVAGTLSAKAGSAHRGWEEW